MIIIRSVKIEGFLGPFTIEVDTGEVPSVVLEDVASGVTGQVPGSVVVARTLGKETAFISFTYCSAHPSINPYLSCLSSSCLPGHLSSRQIVPLATMALH